MIAFYSGKEQWRNWNRFLNSLNPDLKFTLEVGVKSNCFLDLKTIIVIGQLKTTVSSKPTDSHLYLHAKSCHKPSCIRGIQKGEVYVHDAFAVQIMNIHLNQ